MQTREDVMRRYHEYRTHDRADALREVRTITCPEPFCVVDFGPLGYGIMPLSAASFLRVPVIPQEADHD